MTQFENNETEKGPGRERGHERGKNKVTDRCERDDRGRAVQILQTPLNAFCFIVGVIHHKWQHSERQGKLYCLPIKMEASSESK